MCLEFEDTDEPPDIPVALDVDDYASILRRTEVLQKQVDKAGRIGV